MSYGGRASRSSMMVVILLAGIGFGATAHRLFAAPPSFTETVPGIDNYELIVSRLETIPGWSHGRHYHPGHEIVYVLDGNGTLDLEGKSGQRLQPGTISYVPPGKVHAGRNASPKEMFKFILFRLHAKNQPISVELN